MTKTISATEFKAKCLQIMDDVQVYKQEVFITKRGKAVAKLIPIKTQKKTSVLGCMKGTGVIIGDIISPIDVEWNAEKGLF